MDWFLEKVFLTEIEDQCNMAITAFNYLKNNIFTGNAYLTWGLVVIILTSSANISKFFWPGSSRPKKSGVTQEEVDDRASDLKNRLDIDDESPLHNRDLRDDFEHYDERLQVWAKNSENHILIRRFIGPKGSIGFNNMDQNANMGRLDPTTFTVTFWNDAFEIPIIIQEMKNILKTIENITNEKSSFF